MKIYFFTGQIPQLKDLPVTERLARLERASQHLTVPEKTLLNILKLLILIPVFVYVLREYQNWSALLWVVPALCLYVLLIKPVQHGLCVKYLEKVEKE